MGRKATYIRAWRKAGGIDRRGGGYTLDEMVARLAELGVETTGATLSRIERGQQPYSQDLLEAIAEALGVTPADLIENNPEIPPAKVYDLVRKLNERELRQAEDMLKVLFGERA